ncbi:ROK family protein [Arthrobacter crystallopoietes]|uniref:polyphosphate--glucose phosphotransferase n=1 Tax=Crystallibacter crystallopoietes TaxID=37928 RepID=UPI003D1E395B
MALESILPVIGIDIGGTTIKGGLVDLGSGELLGGQTIVPTPQSAPPEKVIDAVVSVVTGLSMAHPSAVIAEEVGITFPGIVYQGLVRSAANLGEGWVHLDVEALMSARLGRRVVLLNDADAAGLAEVRYGAGRGINGLVLVITLGTGIGSALIADGKLIPNAELGHLEIDGCRAETKASARAREREELDWETYAGRLQRYFSHIEYLFSPDLLIVGGGISQRSGDVLPRLNLQSRIVAAELRNSAGTVGAALQAASSPPR